MKKKKLTGIWLGPIIGLIVGALFEYALLGMTFPVVIIVCLLVGLFIGAIVELIKYRWSIVNRRREEAKCQLEKFPACAAEFIKLVIRKMRYRKEVRLDVQEELAAHFEDEMKDCKTGEEKEKRAEQLISDFGDVKLLAVLMRRAKKRCRPPWRTAVVRGFQIIGISILYLVVYCVYISFGKPTISVNYIEKAMLMTRPVADESQNAAPIYQKAIDAYKQPPEIGRQNKDGPAEKLDLLSAIEDKVWIDDLNEQELSLLKQWISDNSQAINLLKQASQKPHCWWDRQVEDNSILKMLVFELNSMKGLDVLLCWRAKLYAFNGDTELAFDDLLACYRLGRHFKGPRFLIEQVDGIRMQWRFARTAAIILDNQTVESDLLQNFQTTFENLMAEDIFIVDFSVEKFYVLDFLQRCYTDNGRGSGHMIPAMLGDFLRTIDSFDENASEKSDMFHDFGKWLAMSLTSANRSRMSREFERLCNIAQQMAYKTPRQLRKDDVDVETIISNWSRLKQIRYWPVMMLVPVGSRMSLISHRNKADFQALLTITALLRYKQDSGDYPDSLDELKNAGFIKELPMDPYSDKPLVYKRKDDNFILYSVGHNFTDDGGVPGCDSGGKFKLWADNGDAVFWPVQK